MIGAAASPPAAGTTSLTTFDNSSPSRSQHDMLHNDARSFTVASTSNLKYPHILHPRAANPVMDLAALVREPDDDHPGVRSLVSLWRLSGATVWEVCVTGRVLGLSWSSDGLFLSLLVLRLPSWPPRAPVNASKSTIEHLSVHTGEVVKAVYVPPTLLEHLTEADWEQGHERDRRTAWWPMEWKGGNSVWLPHKPGAPLMIIDSLPDVEPVEPPKPAIINPFAPPPPAAANKGLHAKLEAASTLLPADPRPPPSVLHVAVPAQRPRASARLLTGTYLLPPGTPEDVPSAILEVAVRADKIAHLLDPVFRGLESCAAAYRDAEKQTMVWREELEACGEQQGMSVRVVHADLFRFLMCRRSSPPITEWLGNRLTNRPVAKWEATVQEGFITVMKVLAQSVIPALERMLLVLEEMNGWARGHHADQAASTLCRFHFDVILDRRELERALSLVRGLLALCEEMRQAAALEWESAVQWFKWLRYEMARAVASEEAGAPSYDVKLVWSYMVNGFVNSHFKQHFPHVIGASDAVLTEVPLPRQPKRPPLCAVMSSTLARLRQPPKNSSLPQTSDISLASLPDRSTSTGLEIESDESDVEPDDSFDTVGENDQADASLPAGTTKREPTLEPWAWANTLLASICAVGASARVRDPSHVAPAVEFPLPVIDERRIGDEDWALALVDKTLHVFARTNSLGHARFSGEVVQAAFYGDEEIALVFARGPRRWLALASVEDMRAAMVPVGSEELSSSAGGPDHHLPISRARALGTVRRDPIWSLALNPAEGRRSAWILTASGEELSVFDLEANEDEESDEASDEESDEEEGMDEEE
ncbi:hypothetical protein CC85DRAFT_314014 [Cutaneotrichosporon oleaginosum]|uniref:Anaphase-promoting complex subunit 4 n=1 Tax=Cutaneotrichosporon oleaginosum TaxID=879819 RepID=A0A0J0XDV2_9TREE|nr:uncharacterized protein CC85DRAFT_314014 [Cutaneotrichosporon oleaginosum]KLT39198.1 hypothetical protein CC85DRAFT_314014 [Cutaneotrichosporon oleaginosum]TXT04413.1 hypothetical protein COLE_07232 [Cutaneotrichosporon oleaginosum]